ncbi:PAS fold-containing protein [Luteibacter sp. UNCMF366Tsu5.1]|nr:PAS fold-containing protein [Luteibacter sp. UNCMF366Tsu5.1]
MRAPASSISVEAPTPQTSVASVSKTIFSTGLSLEVVIGSALVLLPTLLASAILITVPRLHWLPRLSIFLVGLIVTLMVAWWIGRRVLDTLSTVSDLLGALREGDFGMRGRVELGYRPLQALVADVNLLSDTLRDGRRKRTEALRFLGKTLTALSDPVFVVDTEERLTLINPAARQLIGAERQAVLGQGLASLGLTEVLATPDHAVFQGRFPGGEGRWLLRHVTWHSNGREHRLIMLRDLSAMLGDEERRAWQRLIRVLSHELNNSLTPIASLAGSLAVVLNGDGADTLDELRIGLDVIERRAHALARFIAGYGTLARLPPPRPAPFRLDLLLVKLVLLERRVPVEVVDGGPLVIYADEDQLAQAFINLLRNAAEAALPIGGSVRLRWYRDGRRVCVLIEDEGIGLPEPDALFVPLFTTKPQGSGIGLSLTRMIVQAHAGSVDLAPRADRHGAVATVRLPLSS